MGCQGQSLHVESEEGGVMGDQNSPLKDASSCPGGLWPCQLRVLLRVMS